MSSALWHFFWDWDGTPPAPSPSPPPPPATPLPPPPPPGEGSGGGKGWGKGGKPKKEAQLVPSPEDLWEVREAYLRSQFPPMPPAPKPENYESEANAVYLERQQQLEQAASDRAAAILSLRNASDIKTMKSIGASIKELNAKIASLTAKQSFARFMK